METTLLSFKSKLNVLLFAVLAFLGSLTVNAAAVWTATATGAWNSGSTWQLVSGTSATTFPNTKDDDVTISGVRVTVSSVLAVCGSLTVSSTGTLAVLIGQNMNILGNFTNMGVFPVSSGASIYFLPSPNVLNPIVNLGTTLNSPGILRFRPNGSVITITSASTFTVASFIVDNVGTSQTGIVSINGDMTVNSALSLSKTVTINNAGTIRVTAGTFSVFSSGRFNNVTNGVLTTTVNILTDATGVFSAAAPNNTVTYVGKQWKNVCGATYDNLILANDTGTAIATKTISADFTVNSNFRICANVQLDCANKNITCNGVWTDNNPNVSLTNTGGTFTFGGANPTFLFKTNAETFGNVVVACSGSFIPNASNTAGYEGNFTCNNLTLQSGTMDLNSTGNYTATVKGNVSGNGGTMNGQGGGLVLLAGTTAQTINGTTPFTFPDLTVNNASGVNSSCNFGSKNLTLQSGILNLGSSAATISANFNNIGGSMAENGAVIFAGTSNQTINGILTTFPNFTTNNAVGVTANQNFSCKDMNLQSGTLDLNSVGNYTATVKGNMSNTGGILLGQDGMINFNGTSAQTISGNAITFSNININNTSGVSTSSSHNLSGTLFVQAGSFTSNTALFTLLSDNTTGITARIASLPTSTSVAGNKWAIQRRILTNAPSGTSPYWDDFSSPVSNTDLLDWDGPAVNEMYMSRVGGPDGNAGSFISVYQMNNGTGQYNAVTSNIALVPCYGYEIWTASTLSSLSPFTFDSQGTPNQGTITKTLTAANWYLLGNPYPSQILWSAVTRSNVANSFYIDDETLKGFAFWDGATNTGTGKLAGSGGVLNSSQGFFIQSTSANASVTFSETCKTTGNVAFVRAAVPENLVKFHFSADGNQVGVENMIHFMKDGNNDFDEYDISFMPSRYEEHYDVKTLTASGKSLFKNALNMADEKQEVPVVFVPAKRGNYNFSIDGLNTLNAYSCVMLEDISKGVFTDISANKNYAFTCSDNSEKHFVLHFSNNTNGVSCIEKSKAFEKIAENMSIASKVYQNNNNNLTVVLINTDDLQKTSTSVYNIMGQLVYHMDYVGGGTYNFTSPAESGIYFVTLSSNGKTESHKVLVTK